eukprot:m.49479 g.49479  ORF g.49479 m.49479 type:complete len:854 (+) comp10616_c0_seq3:92-2653(+)
MPKSDGHPADTFFKHPKTIECLNALATELDNSLNEANALSEKPTGAKLGKLLQSVIEFQEKYLSKKLDIPITRLPGGLFYDVGLNGAAFIVFKTIFKFKAENNIRKLDFGSSTKLDVNTELFMAIDNAMIEAGHFKRPKIYLSKSKLTPELRTYLADISKKHQMEIVAKKSQADYIIGASKTYEAGEKACIVSKKPSGLTRLHWIRRPDSYDSFEESSKFKAVGIPQQDDDGVKHVSARWLTDTHRYNEYMNPVDYKDDGTDAFAEDPEVFLDKLKNGIFDDSASQKPSGKRKRTSSPSVSSKQAAKRQQIVRLPVKLPPIHTPEPVPKSTPVPSMDNKLSKKGTRMEIPIIEDTDTNMEPKDGNPEDKSKDTKYLKHVETVEEQQIHVVIPSCAAWFDHESISPVEIAALPEFFDGQNSTRAPEIYMAYRNFMIDTYRLSPVEYLTATACRRNLVGDACTIFRVHAFLEQWGLINYQVDFESRPTPMGPPSTSHFVEFVDKPDGIEPILRLPEKNNSKEERIVKLQEPSCNFKLPSRFGLHTDIYMGGENAVTEDSDEWTDQEILYLLEGIEIYGENWSKVAEYVNQKHHGGDSHRSHDDCILAFIRLPIEDPYLNLESMETSRGKSKNEEYVFGNQENPLLATLAFLAQAVDPLVAAAGSKSALGMIGKVTSQGDEKDVSGANSDHTSSSSNKTESTVNNNATIQDSSATEKNAKLNAKTSDDALSKETLSKLSRKVLQSASEKAKTLAHVEEERLKSLVAVLVRTQLQKLEMKIRHFKDIEASINWEYAEMEANRRALEKEKMTFHQAVHRAREVLTIKWPHYLLKFTNGCSCWRSKKGLFKKGNRRHLS